ncbi:ABC transporter substrate-binding protein [Burkholderia gladioli]|uniref:ABC transporter substrate-binding protein n=1 Tax=Burkholderia gladioli TaxID=28095 RepID=UPI000BBD3944|nr:ABC transporter substrate-binding protein [Burkholderia gladioli]ATF90097.1 ABC transporter substrate-binding protein [Burkholderia gladioli pv. gladioli]MBJ9711821.1 ABC transporter substrate-binding protein [Burkholderia gladioli]MBU9157025.1 ABC transporter substrate-binding protein [Burkholderia gladioli]MBU9215036.1 ABC transporter substrate-binding protein [Burkholderia gladioli]MBU9383951.1 ABC transporter substrate-binding protein [Burkholderia gladioli]
MRLNRLCQAAITLAIASANAAPAFAAGQITFVSQGGAYQEAQTKAILDPAAKQLGITINQDSIPDAWPQIKAQGATGKPIWDVVDTPTSNCLRGGHDGLIEKLDYSKMPNAASIPEKYRTPYSVPYEFYSSVIGYNRKTVKKVPHSWADFWNVKGFPGTRALRNDPQTTLEAALLADGVPRDKLYPLDVDRAFRKLAQIKPDIAVWWTSGGQSAQLLHDGEVDMEMIWNGRASAVAKDNPDIVFTYEDGILQNTQLCILKNAPNLANAVRFVDAAVSPDLQANLPKYIDYGPGNPAAYAGNKISAQRAAELPSSPANAAKQALMSETWWASPAGIDAKARWLKFMQQ